MITRIRQAAHAADVKWDKVRDGGQHEIWQLGVTKVSIPRHREINELTAQAICKHLERELGEGWWR